MTKEPAPVPEADVSSYLAACKEEVEAQLEQFLPDLEACPQVIHQAMHYSLFAGGKRIRPVLALATVEALQGPRLPVLHMASALEMIHTYSLIHDDLPAMDDDDFRRGRPTLHRKFGEGIAILAGNGLLTLAFQVLSRIPEQHVSPELKLRVIDRICQAIGTRRGMIAGQAVDLLTEGKSFSESELEYIHSAKTGALMQVSVECAALLSSAPEQSLHQLALFGERLGLAFQVVDDILDVEGSLREMGKGSGRDQVERKATYPALFGVERSHAIANRLVEEAIQALAFLGERDRMLKDLAHFVSVRRF